MQRRVRNYFTENIFQPITNMSTSPISATNQNNNSAAINETVGALLALTWIAVFLRIYVRVIVLKKLHMVDYSIILTQVWPLASFRLPKLGNRLVHTLPIGTNDLQLR
jgi:hypothetical protein